MLMCNGMLTVSGMSTHGNIRPAKCTAVLAFCLLIVFIYLLTCFFFVLVCQLVHRDGCADLNMMASSMLSNPRMSSPRDTYYVEWPRMV